MINIPSLFLLQQGTMISIEDTSFSPVDLVVIFAIAAVIIGGLIMLNKLNKKGGAGGGVPSSGMKKGGGGGGGVPTGGSYSFFQSMAVRKIARNLGLNNEQTKMLDFVFKLDQVSDPERSINTPVILDRHFMKAYRFIENAATLSADTQRKLGILFSTRNMLENSVLGAITSTKELKEDMTFLINTGKEKLSVHLVNPKGDYLLVEPPRNVLGSQIKIQRGAKLTVLFFTRSDKGFSFETNVVGYTSYNGHPAMQLAHSNKLRFLSHRRYRRRQTSIACNMYLVYVESVKKKQRLIVDKRRLQGKIIDISVGGCSMKMMVPVKVGARFKIEFTQGNENVAALGQVLRMNRMGMNTVIHIRFLKLPLRSMNLINAYVYEYGDE